MTIQPSCNNRIKSGWHALRVAQGVPPYFFGRVFGPSTLVLALLLIVPGCVTTLPWTSNQEAAPGICQVIALWEGRIVTTQDVVNGGQPLSGLAGRMYLYGPEFKYPEKGDGAVAVDLYDVTNLPPGGQPKLLERWQLDPGNLAKLLRKDKIGLGYTLFLPWSTYRPDITRVQLNICYTTAKGAPVYSQPTTISLRNEATLTQTRQVGGQSTVVGVTKQ
jgi:hypothetical protein